jgi:hypothetical protein
MATAWRSKNLRSQRQPTEKPWWPGIRASDAGGVEETMAQMSRSSFSNYSNVMGSYELLRN